LFFYIQKKKKKKGDSFSPHQTGKYLKGLKMSSIGENLEQQKLSYNG